MVRVLSWNVRGVNSPKKQNEVKKFIHKHSVGLVGHLESKVKSSHLGELFKRMFGGLSFSSNINHHVDGRIF